MNGDGKGDLFDKDHTGYFVQLSTGTGLKSKVSLALSHPADFVCPDGDLTNKYPRFGPASSNSLVDFDADGKADFVGARYTLSTSTDPVTESVYCSVRRSLELYRNTTPPGSSAVTFSLTFAEPYTYVSGGDEPRFADLDGDGLPELIGDSHGGGYGFRRNLGQGVFGPLRPLPRLDSRVERYGRRLHRLVGRNRSIAHPRARGGDAALAGRGDPDLEQLHHDGARR